jgi:C4-dicarboxylate-specific signal transduction histidine kinase
MSAVMIEFTRNLLASDFMPHGVCFLWNPGIMWLHAISDAVIALSYYLIPLALVYFVRKRRDLPFHWMFLLFGVFIFACGTTHVMGLWTLWHGTYRLEGVIKAVTAAASVGTAVLLVHLLPDALALPSPAQLRAANDDLEREIAHRRRVEHALVEAHDHLEATVQQRTAELARANEELKAEMQRRQAEEAERVRAEHTVRRMQAELAHVGRVTVMGELAASIAHEVSQPIAAVVTNASACLRWMTNDPPNHAEAHESVTRILRDGRRAGEIIRRIRALLKKSPPTPTEQDVNALLRDVLALVHDALATHRIDARVELADVPPVMGDRIQLQQVLLNLVMNGVDAMNECPDGPRNLVVSSWLLDTGEVTMTVKDSGVGVDPALFDKLFEPFFTTKPEGMGMGLSVSRSIVESHGGRLWASSNEGQGASFHVSLPGVHA